MDNTTLKRAQVAGAAALIGYVAGAVIAAAVSQVRKTVPASIPLTAAASVAATVFIIDWLTERRGRLG